MQSLASRLFPDSSWRHPGDLAWALTLAGEPERCPTAVWRDGERVVAWGWLESPDELTVQVDPDPRYAALADEVLAWAEKATADVGGEAWDGAALSTTISANESHIAAALVARGYVAAPDGPFFSCLGIDLTSLPPAAELPAGYTLRHCDDASVALRAEAHRAAWSYWNSAYSEQQHTAMRGLWPYKPEFDLMAIAPDGTAAAYYQGWYDEDSRVALFEPVGTRPDHRRRGLSRAIGITLLHRFAAAGGRTAVVCPRGDDAYTVARLTYESMGFTAFSRTHTYRKPARSTPAPSKPAA
jgi:GNAT superfamily N-acetyltransferase